ncbi:MAG: acetate--CoA ligase family protein, partial [Motiliproteus sp.]|nr:acetate--CoA ligase family protein [Motiliproteus sp.]
ASGFAEMGGSGSELESQLLKAANDSGVRIIGPNTSGIFNLHKNLNLLALDSVSAGEIGIISQSGNMLLSLVLEAADNGHIGFSTYVGPGNQSDLGFSDYLQFLAEDPNTKVATFYVEGFTNGREFIDQARKVSLDKPVVVYKSGSTEAGQKAAASHTGSLAGSYQMTRDLLQQAGVTVVGQSDEILPVAEGLALMQQAKGNRVAILADGGGQATIATDRIAEAGLQIAKLSDHTKTQLTKLLFDQASVINPVDVAGSTDANPQLLSQCADILLQDSGVDMVFLVGMFGGYSLRFAKEMHQAEMQTASDLAELTRSQPKPLVVYSLYQPVKPEPLRLLRKQGVAVYSSIEQAVQIMVALAGRGRHIQKSALLEIPLPLAPDHASTELLQRAQDDDRHPYEHEAKQLLQNYRVDVPTQRFINQVSDLDNLPSTLCNQPLAMKVVSRDILHKSDAGGVRLNLQGSQDLKQGYDAIMDSCRTYQKDADIAGVIVTPMVAKGVEIIIGVSRDAIFGPVLMFGLGGIFVEILKDVAFRSIPVSRQDAWGMIDQIKARQILDGARGEQAIDKEALVELLLTTSRIIETHPEISELDLNPVIAYPTGYAIVDARIIADQPTTTAQEKIA